GIPSRAVSKSISPQPARSNPLSQWKEPVMSQKLRAVELLPKPARGNPPPAGKPFLPFPVHEMPVGLREYVREGALALGCDPACLAVLALAVVASAIGTTRGLRLKPGWDEPCVLRTAVVGDGGRA